MVSSVRFSATLVATALFALPAGGCSEDPRPRAVAPPAPTAVSRPATKAAPLKAAAAQPEKARAKAPAAPAAQARKPAAQRPPRPAAAKRPASASKKVMWDAPIAWRSLSGAAEASKKSGKPILMMVFADW